jgi:hypothetical protein
MVIYARNPQFTTIVITTKYGIKGFYMLPFPWMRHSR